MTNTYVNVDFSFPPLLHTLRLILSIGEDLQVTFPAGWAEVDYVADTATFLEKGSYKITSSEGEPFAYVLEDVLALEGFDSTMSQSTKDDLVQMMPNAFETLLAKDT